MVYWNNFKKLIQLNNNNDSLYTLTFQVTKDCNCNCSYCYETNKEKIYMSKENGKKCIDFFFNNFLNSNIEIVGLNFIGGEPLLNLDTIDYICSYFIKQCCKYKKDKWLQFCNFSFITNGTLCNSETFYKFLNKYKDFLFFTITIDGPEITHDSCRKYLNGKGTFNDVFNNWKNLIINYSECVKAETKITISPDNLSYLTDTVLFFMNNNFEDININPIFEHCWNYEEAHFYYLQLKKIIDLFIEQNIDKVINFEFLNLNKFLQQDKSLCGCFKNKSLTFDTQGNIYNCIRFTDSIKNNYKEYKIGKIDDDIFFNQIFSMEQQIVKEKRDMKCLQCPINSGCKFCPAYNYLSNGDLFIDNTNLCLMHKAEYLASIYYQKKYFNKNIKNVLSLEETLKIIQGNEEEYGIYFT